MSEQRVQILIRLLLRSSLIRIYTVCHSFYFFWRHYFIVKLNCFILRITRVARLGVPIFRVFTVVHLYEVHVHVELIHYLQCQRWRQQCWNKQNIKVLHVSESFLCDGQCYVSHAITLPPASTLVAAVLELAKCFKFYLESILLRISL